LRRAFRSIRQKISNAMLITVIKAAILRLFFRNSGATASGTLRCE